MSISRQKISKENKKNTKNENLGQLHAFKKKHVHLSFSSVVPLEEKVERQLMNSENEIAPS
jgi:hypothetical protein